MVISPGAVLCAIEDAQATKAKPTGCYAEIPALVSLDMSMFRVDSEQHCACGLAMDNPSDPGAFLSAHGTNRFEFFASDVYSVEFMVWDIETGVKLRSISKFALAPNLNTGEFLKKMLTDTPQFIRNVAGFYGSVNDFNPADYINNATREITYISFAVVITYSEVSGKPEACNAEVPGGGNAVGAILAVPSCTAPFLLDSNYEWRTYPFRIFQPINTPAYKYKIAAGSSNMGGDQPGGSHAVHWSPNNFTGPGMCETAADCDANFFCDYSTQTCQQCILDSHCARFNTDEFNARCVANNGHRVCQFVPQDYGPLSPGAKMPKEIRDCSPQCQGQVCSVSGKCVECNDINDCELKFTPAARYAKSCNATGQCNYVYMPSTGKRENRALIIGVVVGAVVLIAIVAAVVVAVMMIKYKRSNVALKDKERESNEAGSSLSASPLYTATTKKQRNPLFKDNEMNELQEELQVDESSSRGEGSLSGNE